MQICPKCRHLRQADATVPGWQCPACGVAYTKAAGVSAHYSSQAVPAARRTSGSRASGLPWGKVVLVLAIGFGIWQGHRSAQELRAARLGEGAEVDAAPAASLDAAGIRALASSVKATQVVMYSTTECTYCAQAKGWLAQNGFAFTECNMSVERRCEDEFRSYGASGTPFLVLTNGAGRTHHMKNGFDSDEFLAALS